MDFLGSYIVSTHQYAKEVEQRGFVLLEVLFSARDRLGDRRFTNSPGGQTNGKDHRAKAEDTRGI